MKAIEKGVSVKTFLGIVLAGENKNKISQNILWNQSTGQEKTFPYRLEIITRNHKDYLGIFMERSMTTAELKPLVLFFIEKCEPFLPKSTIEAHTLIIFPQIFIS